MSEHTVSGRRAVQVARRLGALVASVAIGAALVVGVLAPAAQAFHIPGATYNGTHAFGTLSFTVTPDGSGISRFGVTGTIPGNTCTFSGSETTYIQPLPIINHAFSDTSPPGLTEDGSFNAVQSASGTFRIQVSGGFACSTQSVSWNATTTASPAGSEECVNATQAVEQAKKKLKKADSRKAKKKAKKKLKEAQEQQQAVCG